MKTISLSHLQAQVRVRKVVHGIIDSAAQTDALRNKGATRTEAKRELLRRVDQRARDAGLESIVGYS